MSAQFFEKALASLKRANKERKLKSAQAAGYNTVEEYQAFLEAQIKLAGQNSTEQAKPKSETTKKKVVKPKATPIIFMIDILDASISMGDRSRPQSKIAVAEKGIKSALEDLKQSKEAVEYHYGFCTFSERRMYSFTKPKKLSATTSIPDFRMGGATALYDAIGKTLNTLMDIKRHAEYKDAKFLVNIYTDGGENNSSDFSSHSVKSLINEAEQNGFTVTFVGTEMDVKNVQTVIKIDASNTLSYDGSAQGMQMAMATTSLSKAAYVSNVIDGKDVTRGFYKNVNTKK